ncbi:MAG TPA: hypothetical protein VFD58_30580 [Blastocatellia bacterium]|nr:hypothetical protein [Blastocatellia bacterium]
MMPTIPFIDPNVQHVGISKLRALNASSLSNLDKTWVIQDDDTPIAVLLTYEQFLSMQNQLQQVLNAIELLQDKDETAALIAGLHDTLSGNTKDASEVRKSLKERRPPRE